VSWCKAFIREPKEQRSNLNDKIVPFIILGSVKNSTTRYGVPKEQIIKGRDSFFQEDKRAQNFYKKMKKVSRRSSGQLFHSYMLKMS